MGSLKRLSYELNVKVPEDDGLVLQAKNRIKAYLMEASSIQVSQRYQNKVKVKGYRLRVLILHHKVLSYRSEQRT